MTRRVALHHLCATEVPASELVEIAAQCGIPDVSLFVRHSIRSQYAFPVVSTESEAVDLRIQMASAGVGLHNLEVFPLSPRCDVESFRPDIERGVSMGARRATAHIQDDDPVRAHENFAAFCALAREYGIAVSIEFMTFTTMKTLEQAAVFVEASNQPNASLVLDALHLRRTGGTIDMLHAVDRKLIQSVQLCDAPLVAPDDPYGEAVENRILPGQGELPLVDILRAVEPGVLVDLEVPLGRLRDNGMPALERVRLTLEAANGVFAGAERRP